ncbi:MAG: polysaccharide deacetylase [Oscillospiraceae bacterium]|jgi:peptidoglycan/xylan/chitin deacetylase (PgdA/CDA1 family)|nr:polysaccharide deacetylase [Oscillospiraceae bacterium]
MIKPHIFLVAKCPPKSAIAIALSAIAVIVTSICLISYKGDVECGIMPYTIQYANGQASPQTDTSEKIAYLTFDDGPAKYTPQVLDILDKYEIKATFFVVGDTEYSSYMTDIVTRGHAIGLHTYSHKFEQIYRSSDAFFADFSKIDKLVYKETGLRSKIMRFAGGSSVRRGSSKSMMRELSTEVQARGYQYFDWNCESGDKRGVKTASGVLSRVKSTAKDAGNAVTVLMHDTEKVTVTTLPDVIEYFKQQGFTFAVLTPETPAVQHTW